GPEVVCHHAPDQKQEAGWIAARIEVMRSAGIPFRNIAVLYRAHYVTRSLEEAFIEKKLPYVIYSGVQFFGRAEIKDALCYLRMIVYKDDLSFLRIANVPKRNLGKVRMKFLKEYAEEHRCTLYEALLQTYETETFKGTKAASFISLIESYARSSECRPVSEVLSAILNESGYEKVLRTEGSQERLDNLAELKQSVYEYETTCGEEVTLEHYLKHIALFTNADTAETGDKVRLMTVHAAKGLEFPHVILCGMNEGIFPSRKVRTKPAMEEERRLAFVAMTRAEKTLALTESEGRNLDGSPRYPSRFILDIDHALLNYTEPPREGLIADAREYAAFSEQSLRDADEREPFRPGDRVRHPVFGEGTVTDTDLLENIYTVQFDGIRTPRAISFRAKLDPAVTDS
ncbi:MAG: ATP-binding domain-containing protein, partial [Lachnospiraceae bacterium]|nr:ATP-binding domain-containing protein [Lachnospiraceae bacterium]